MDLRRQQADLKFKFEDDIRGKLSPAQQVRLIIQVEEMQRRVAEALRQVPGGRLGPRQGGPDAPAGGIRRGIR